MVLIEAVGVDEDLADLVPLPLGEAEDGDDGARGHEDAGLRVELHPNARDELFAEEDLEFTPEPALVFFGQYAEEENFLLEYCFPFRSEGLGEDALAAAELTRHRPIGDGDDG